MFWKVRLGAGRMGVVIAAATLAWVAAGSPTSSFATAADAPAKSPAAPELRADNVMDYDPELVIPGWVYKFSPLLKPLWLKALARPDAETRRMAADTFSIAAHRQMPDIQDAAPLLLKVAQEDQDPVVRRAAIRAVVALQAKSAAPELVKLAAADGLLAAQIVEPALAEWGDSSLATEWRERLERPEVERARLLLAIECLARLKDSGAVAALDKLVADENGAPEVRTAAARAVGEIRVEGGVETAQRLAASQTRVPYLGRLLAGEILRRHHDERALALLQTLVKDDEPAVAAAALEALWRVERRHALPFAPAATASADARLRRVAAEILVEQGDVAAVQALGPLLNDRNPGLRRFVAAHFVQLAKSDPALSTAVIEQAVRMLGTDQWRGLEQAAFVVGALDHEPAAARLVELLTFPRGETAHAVGWALRQLKVADTYPRILDHAKKVHEKLPTEPVASWLGKQQSQVFQLFGEVGFRDAESLMRLYVPKSTALNTEARAAAVWSLGHFYKGVPENDLVDLYVERLSDVGVPLPEFGYVRQMTAVGLGRMGAKQKLDVLRKFMLADGPRDKTGLACGWAVERFTGEKMPVAPIREDGVPGWFLEPFSTRLNTPETEDDKRLKAAGP
ncbi:MAG: HEAT repeat domain-containing protein [Pirellulales bacterium]